MELKGINYFPFSIDFFENDRIALLEAEFGNDGTIVILKLFTKIYRNGYYLEWGADECLLFSRKNGMAEKTVQAIVGKAIDRGLFDRESFERFGILTSIEIQEQFFTVAAKRKNKLSNEMNYLLIGLSKYKSVRTNENSQPKPETDAKIRNQPGENSTPPDHSKGKNSKRNFSSSSCMRETATNCGKIFAGFQAELLDNEDWRASVVRMSGKSIASLQVVPEVMDMFDMHVISIGKSGEIRNSNQYAEHFINWWRCMKFRSAAEIDAYNQQRIQEAKRSAQPETKSKVRQAVELGNVVSANVKKIMLG